MKLRFYRQFVLLFLLFGVNFLYAQVTVTTLVIPPYQSRIADYASNPQLMLITLTNTATYNVEVQLTGKINGDNGISAWVKPGYRSPNPIHIGAGQTVSLNGQDIAFLFDINKIEYTGISRADMTRGLGLLEGNYTLCIRALDYKSLQPLSPEQTGCNTFRISDLEPPRILAPFNKQKIDNKGPQVFPISWTTPTGASPSTQYKVKIVEMIAPRNPNDAIQSTRPLVEETVSGNMLVYGPTHPALIQGREYAMVVQAQDPTLKSKFRNQGLSEVSTFVYGESSGPGINLNTPMQVKSAAIEPNCNCTVPLPLGEAITGLVGTDASNNSIQVGAFTMQVKRITSQNPLSGEGVIELPAFGGAKLKVSFDGIAVNAQRQMLSGRVNSMIDPNGTFLPDPNAILNSFSGSQASQLINYFRNNPTKMLDQIRNGNIEFALPLGLSSGDNTLAISNISFTAQKAWFKAVAGINAPEALGGAISFIGDDLCFEGTSDLCGEGVLALGEDLKMSNLLTLLKKGDSADQPGTQLLFDKNGVKSLTINASVQPIGMVDANRNPLVGKILVEDVSKWNDWIGEITFPKFSIQGLEAISFDLAGKKVYVDNSDLKNPTSLPANYQIGNESLQIGGNAWRGVFIENISVNLPNILEDLSGNMKKNVAIDGKNIIIDANGFTGAIATSGQLLELKNGSLGGWYASIEKVELNFFKSSFKNSNIQGKLVLPASKSLDDVNNQLPYTATLSTPSQGAGIMYSFEVSNKGTNGQGTLKPKFDALVADVELSTFEVIVQGGSDIETYASANLSGKISIGGSALEMIPGIRSLDLGGMQFSNLGFDTRREKLMNDNGGKFKMGEESGALIERKIGGFGFKLSTGSLEIGAANGGISFGLPISGQINLVEAGPINAEAKATFVLKSGLGKNAQSGRIEWSGVSGEIRELALGVDAKLGPLGIKGAIKYYKTSNDEGIVGALETDIVKLMTITLRAKFGQKRDAEGAFNYFEFAALTDFGKMGITFLPTPPMALYGFGGGIGYNMRIADLNQANVSKMAENTEGDEGGTFSSNLPSSGKTKGLDENSSVEALLAYNPGMEMVPDRGKFTLSAKVLFGLTSRNVLDAEAGFGITFDTKALRISNMGIDGKARILTDISKPLSERDQFSTGLLSLGIRMDFEHAIYTADARGTLGVPRHSDKKLLYVDASMAMYASSDGWNIKIGTPNVPNRIEVLGLLRGTSYLEIGSKEIDDMPPIPEEIRLLAGGQADRMIMKPVENRENYTASSGFIAGATVSLGDPEKRYEFLMFYGKLFAKAGFDVSIKNGTICSNLPNAGGAGRWYAKGQAYFGAYAKAGIVVNLFFVKGEYEIFSAGVGATINVGLPNPLYAAGRVGGTFNILNGAVGGNFSLGFEIGEKCQQGGLDALGVQLITELYPSGLNMNDQGQQVAPINTSIGALFNMKFGPFEVDEYLEDKPNPVKRYFLFDQECITYKLNDKVLTKEEMASANAINLNEGSSMYGNTAFFYNSPGYLTKNTKYRFKVKATIKENKTKDGSPANYQKLPDNPENYEESTVEFMTDSGFRNLPASEIAITGPLHSNKSVLLKESGLRNGEWFVESKKVVDLQKNFVYEGDYKLKAKVYEGTTEVLDADVKLSNTNGPFFKSKNKMSTPHSLFSFNGPNLKPKTNYTVLIYVHEVQNENVSGSIIQRNTAVKSSIADGYKINISTASLVKGNNASWRFEKPILAGYTFNTSEFDYMKEKIDATKLIYMYKPIEIGSSWISSGLQNISVNSNVSQVVASNLVSATQAKQGNVSPSNSTSGDTNLFYNVMSGGENNKGISIANTKEVNKTYFESIVKPDVNGDYIIGFGVLDFNWPMEWIMRGEPLNFSDYNNVTSNQIFKVQSLGQNNGVGGENMNILFETVSPILLAQYANTSSAGGDLFRPYNAIKLAEFISEQTGIPLSKVKTSYNIGFNVNTGSAIKVEDAYQESVTVENYQWDATSSLGAPIMYEFGKDVSSSSGLILNESLFANSAVLNQQIFGVTRDPALRRTILVKGKYHSLTGDPGAVVGLPQRLGNPIQSVINKLINPVGEMRNVQKQGTNVSNTKVWESVGAITTNFQQQNISQQQMEQQVGQALRMR